MGLYVQAMSDLGSESYLELLVQMLERTRRLMHRGRLNDPESRKDMVTLELEVAVAQLKTSSARRSGQILMLPTTDAVHRLTRPVREESRRLRTLSQSTRARSHRIRLQRTAAGS